MSIKAAVFVCILLEGVLWDTLFFYNIGYLSPHPEAFAYAEGGVAVDVVQFAEGTDGGVVALGQLAKGVAAADGVVFGAGGGYVVISIGKGVVFAAL